MPDRSPRMVVTGIELGWRRARTAPATLRRRLRAERWLILAPHPDDETLGAGALIHELSRNAIPFRLAYLTDGAASAPGSRSWPPSRLRQRRKQEAKAALRQLVGHRREPQIVFLDWADGAPCPTDSPGFRCSLARLARLCRRDRISAIAVTAAVEPHGDHGAAFELAAALAGSSLRRLTIFQYLVWSAPRDLATRPVLALDAAPSLAARRAALACHRTQLGGLITDSDARFRLPPRLARLRPGGVEPLFPCEEYRHAA